MWEGKRNVWITGPTGTQFSFAIPYAKNSVEEEQVLGGQRHFGAGNFTVS